MDFPFCRNTGATLLLVFSVILCPVLISSRGEPAEQPYNVNNGDYDDLKDDGVICTRHCQLNQTRLCYYKFYLEQYTVLTRACGNCPNVTSDCFKPQCVTADGFERGIFTVNRALPGPSIQVCQGDTVVVDVTNGFPGRSTTIHWHGLHQRGTPYMDGVPYVSMCPITQGQTFRFRYNAAESGTLFWHSHDGLQKVDGIEGHFIVREPDQVNILRDLYDFDLPSHVVIFHDWMHTTADERYPGFLYRETGQHPVTYLINGRGIQLNQQFEFVGSVRTPVSEFRVRQGYRYRFRFIGGTCLSCPFRVSIQDHELLAIAIDRNPIDPVEVDSAVISAGERYDFVIEASRPVNSYWIYVEGLGECRDAVQVGLLVYEGATGSRPLVPPGDTDDSYMLNPYNSMCDEASLATEGPCVSQLTNPERNPPQISKEPDVRVLLTFGFHLYSVEEVFEPGHYRHFFVAPSTDLLAGQMNEYSYISPPSPLLTQYDDIPPEMFCYNTNCVDGEVCECVHVIKVPLNSVVEFLMVDMDPPSPAMLSHPFHIHGHDFYVLEQGILPKPFDQGLMEIQKRLARPRNISHYLPKKDTVTVPSMGYAVLRIYADNPGFWFYHCHFAYHQESGMAFTLQVGERPQMPAPPPGFPFCYQYLPPFEVPDLVFPETDKNVRVEDGEVVFRMGKNRNKANKSSG